MASMEEGSLSQSTSEGVTGTLSNLMQHRAQSVLIQGCVTAFPQNLEPIIVQRLIREYTRLELLLQGYNFDENFILFVQDFVEWEITDQQCLQLELSEQKALSYLEALVPFTQKEYTSRNLDKEFLPSIFDDVASAMVKLFEVASSVKLTLPFLISHIRTLIKRNASELISQPSEVPSKAQKITKVGLDIRQDNDKNDNILRDATPRALSFIQSSLPNTQENESPVISSATKELGKPFLGHSPVVIRSGKVEKFADAIGIDAPTSLDFLPPSSLSSSQVAPQNIIEQTQPFENSQEAENDIIDDSQNFPKSHQPRSVIEPNSSVSSRSEIQETSQESHSNLISLKSIEGIEPSDRALESQATRTEDIQTRIDDNELVRLISQLRPIGGFIEKIPEFQKSLAALENQNSSMITKDELNQFNAKIEDKFSETLSSAKILSEYLDRRINGVLGTVKEMSSKATDFLELETRMVQITGWLNTLNSSVSPFQNFIKSLKNSQDELERKLRRIENQLKMFPNPLQATPEANIKWQSSDFDVINRVTDQNVNPKLAQIEEEVKVLAKIVNKLKTKTTSTISRNSDETNYINQTLSGLKMRLDNLQRIVESENVGERLNRYDETILLLDYNQLKVIEKLDENELLRQKLTTLEKQQLSQKQVFEDELRVQSELHTGRIESLDQSLRQSQEANRYMSRLLLVYEKKLDQFEKRLKNLESSQREESRAPLTAPNLANVSHSGGNVEVKRSLSPGPLIPRSSSLKRHKLISSPSLASFQAPPLKRFKIFKGLQTSSNEKTGKEDVIASSPVIPNTRLLNTDSHDSSAPLDLTQALSSPSVINLAHRRRNTNSIHDRVSVDESIVINSSDDEP